MLDLGVYFLNLLAQGYPGSQQDPDPMGEGVAGAVLGIGFFPLIVILLIAAFVIPFAFTRWKNPKNP